MKMQLGCCALVVMDHDPQCLGLIDALIKNDSDLSTQYVTLLYCCPASYWEHGGDSSKAEGIALEDEIAQVDARYARTVETANRLFASARQMLRAAGVPEAHITSRISCEEDNLARIVSREVETSYYSAVLVDQRHEEVVSRLTKRGIWKFFSAQTPEVMVWAIDIQESPAPTVS